MKALIVAAGQGTRLRSLAPSKPMAEVAGKPLIEHVVVAALAGGIDGFAVVTGYAAGRVEPFLATLAQHLGVAIEIVRNPEWERPNGLSVLAAAPRLESEFALLMSDHLFDPAILAGTIAGRQPQAAVTLAADFEIANPLLDIDDATKLAVSGDGRIERIGKTLDAYNAVDTGIFVASQALPEAIAAAIADGATGSISDGMQRLASAGRAFAYDCGGRWWLDVDDAAAFAKAETALGAPQPSAAT